MEFIGNKKSKTVSRFKWILFCEIAIVFFMAFGFLPREFSYFILALLAVSFIKLNLLESLGLFILSVPFFVAFPENRFSDSMSIWRILIIILFLKTVYEKYKNCHPELVSGSIIDKGFAFFQFVKQGIVRMVNNDGYIQKILKQSLSRIYFGIQNDKIKFGNSCCKLFILTALFFIIALLSLLFAQNTGVGIKKILFLTNIFLLFPVAVFAIKKESDFMGVMKAVLFSSTAVVFIGYLQFISTFFIPLHNFWQFWAKNIIKSLYGEGLSGLLAYSNTWFSYYKTLPPTLRMFSVMPDSHAFAMFAVVSIPAVLFFLFRCEGRNRKCLSAILIFFLMSIFFSGSRGAWVGSVFAFFSAAYLLYGFREPLAAESFSKLCFFLQNNHIVAKPGAKIASLFFGMTKKVKNSVSDAGKVFLEQMKNSGLSKVGYFASNGLNFIALRFSKEDDIMRNNRLSAKMIVYSVILFFVLMPVSFLILKQNQEIQLFEEGISSSGREDYIFFERAISIYDFSDVSNKGRLQIWKETLASIKNHSFFGIGIGNFPSVLGENLSAAKKGSSAHSIYLDIAAETGIFGLAAFLFILAEILKKSRDLFYGLEKKYLKIFAGSFFVYFSWVSGYGFFDVVILNDKVLMLLTIMIAILYSLEKIDRGQSNH